MILENTQNTIRQQIKGWNLCLPIYNYSDLSPQYQVKYCPFQNFIGG